MWEAKAKICAGVSKLGEQMGVRMTRAWIEGGRRLCGALRDQKGQGTTEYAILVGVLVVIAIIAVVAFRGKLQELWNAISTNVNSL
jgi:Flp pilus assembly pilin Flp